ncbi:sugar phosphate isomerase/epimerase [Reyranella sp.]|uniref:sugar phosphate isomerase/epimerase family protein n=1 Tax=Reyranella sp. TaxID=1929291 RepID=UPI00273014D6|nr:sugar phosphate isomerase/epimerase [Reyranella sp.]MDP2378507.1 sugar phosphate isomerase/epimerase [Reyranella sp.]
MPLLAGLGLSRGGLAQPRSWLPGLQLFTVRDALAADPDGTLRRVADTGYREVELAGLAGMTAAAFQQRLKRHGLAVPSIHVGYDNLRGDLGGIVREAFAFGTSFVVCPSIDAEERRTADDWKRVCRTLAQAGRAVRSHGLTLAYHNRDYEFVLFADGATPFDLLLRETDPEDVKLELDVYWAARGGLDPVRCLRDNASRIALLHLKDLGQNGATVELGAGVLAMEPIVRAALAIGTKHMFVEQDDSADPMRSIGISLKFLEGLPADVRPR